MYVASYVFVYVCTWLYVHVLSFKYSYCRTVAMQKCKRFRTVAMQKCKRFNLSTFVHACKEQQKLSAHSNYNCRQQLKAVATYVATYYISTYVIEQIIITLLITLTAFHNLNKLQKWIHWMRELSHSTFTLCFVKM